MDYDKYETLYKQLFERLLGLQEWMQTNLIRFSEEELIISLQTMIGNAHVAMVSASAAKLYAAKHSPTSDHNSSETNQILKDFFEGQ